MGDKVGRRIFPTGAAWQVLRGPVLDRRCGSTGFVARVYGGLRRGVEGRRAVCGQGFWLPQVWPGNTPHRN